MVGIDSDFRGDCADVARVLRDPRRRRSFSETAWRERHSHSDAHDGTPACGNRGSVRFERTGGCRRRKEIEVKLLGNVLLQIAMSHAEAFLEVFAEIGAAMARAVERVLMFDAHRAGVTDALEHAEELGPINRAKARKPVTP